MTPRLYVLVGVLLAGLLAGFTAGWKTQAWRFQAIQHQQEVAQRRDTLKRVERVDEAAAGHEQFKAQEEIRYVDRIKIVRQLVDRPVYRNVCLDGDGLRLLNDAIAGTITDSGQPAPAMPAAAKP